MAAEGGPDSEESANHGPGATIPARLDLHKYILEPMKVPIGNLALT